MNKNNGSNKAGKPQNSILVSGITDAVKGLVEMFFENKDKSGGDELKSIEYEETSGQALLTYKDIEGLMTACFKK